MKRKYNNWRFLLTSACNANCFFCHRDGTDQKGFFLDYFTFDKIIDKFSKQITKLRFAGGEPFLHPDLFKMIKRVLPITKDVGVVTNGLLLSKYFKEIKESNLSKLTVSLHTLNENSFEKITGVNKLEHKKIINSIANLKNYLKIKINVVILKNINTTEEDLNNLIYFVIENNLDIEFIELDSGSLKEINFKKCHLDSANIKYKLEELFDVKLNWDKEESNWVGYIRNSKIEVHQSLCINKLCEKCIKTRPILMYPDGTVNRCRLGKPLIKNLSGII